MHNYLIITNTHEFMWETADRYPSNNSLLCKIPYLHVLQQINNRNYQFTYRTINRSEFS